MSLTFTSFATAQWRPRVLQEEMDRLSPSFVLRNQEDIKLKAGPNYKPALNKGSGHIPKTKIHNKKFSC